MLEFLKSTKSFINKGTKHEKIIWKVKTQKIKILKVSDPLKFNGKRYNINFLFGFKNIFQSSLLN